MTLTDPVTGDILTVVPGNGGRAMLAQRDYAEFAALPTASGLVVTPYVDDLVGRGRRCARHHHPARRPVADAAADAGGGNPRGTGCRTTTAPAFWISPAWGPLTGGSFLATERRLTQSVARLPASKANHARLVLARFYLANRFAAEALGLINLIQASDPGRCAATPSSPPCAPPPIT